MLLNIKYSFLNLIREFSSVFWCALFPLLLATLFSMTFGSLLSLQEFEPVKVGLVINNEDSNFIKVVDGLNGDYLLPEEMTAEEAVNQMKNDKIAGYYIVSDEVSLKIKGENTDTSVLFEILSEYEKNGALIEKTLSVHPENIQAALNALEKSAAVINNVGLSGKVININNQFFYALIAMACLYGNFLGLDAVVNIQANLSTLGARRSVAPTHKFKVIGSEFIVNVSVHIVDLMVLLIYLKILGVVLGGSAFQMILICMIGAINGVALGMLIGSLGKWSRGIKTGISLGISMFASFLAGLMSSNMKGIVQEHFPMLNSINPAARISDAFYSLTVYDSLGRYYSDVFMLCIESVIMLIIAFIILRRERYDSI